MADHELVIDIGLIEVDWIYFKQAHIDQGDGEQFVKDVKTLISRKTGNARLLKISYEFLDQLIDKVLSFSLTLTCTDALFCTLLFL